MTAKIELPHLPYSLYRYRSLKDGEHVLNRELAAIVDGYLWCSDFTQMNDPMEGFYTPTNFLQKDKNAEIIMQAIMDQKTTIGIACFSETYESELMWTHYAGDYGGMCVAYSSRRLQSRLDDTARLVRVAYGEKLPLLTYAEAHDTESAARIILSHKKMNWYYEREWRVLGSKGITQLKSVTAGRLISAVYLGSRINIDYRKEIIRQLDPLGIHIYDMTVTGYKHKWELQKSRRPILHHR